MAAICRMSCEPGVSLLLSKCPGGQLPGLSEGHPWRRGAVHSALPQLCPAPGPAPTSTSLSGFPGALSNPTLGGISWVWVWTVLGADEGELLLRSCSVLSGTLPSMCRCDPLLLLSGEALPLPCTGCWCVMQMFPESDFFTATWGVVVSNLVDHRDPLFS